jgi:hypothetical protein
MHMFMVLGVANFGMVGFVFRILLLACCVEEF